MAKTLPDIIYDKDKVTSILDAKYSSYRIPYYKDEEYLSSYDSYTSFIKGCEKLVRTNDRYNKYIHYLKEEIKLNRCSVLKNVTDRDCDIEMHHGPIFTLYDYCAIVVEYYMLKKWKISTPRIADTVLEEHFKNRIQVVMVSVTMHQEIHNGNIFINQKQAFGNIKEFINKYDCAITDDYRDQVNRYIDKCLIQDSTDFGILELNPKLIYHEK